MTLIFTGCRLDIDCSHQREALLISQWAEHQEILNTNYCRPVSVTQVLSIADLTLDTSEILSRLLIGRRQGSESLSQIFHLSRGAFQMSSLVSRIINKGATKDASSSIYKEGPERFFFSAISISCPLTVWSGYCHLSLTVSQIPKEATNYRKYWTFNIDLNIFPLKSLNTELECSVPVTT